MESPGGASSVETFKSQSSPPISPKKLREKQSKVAKERLLGVSTAPDSPKKSSKNGGMDLSMALLDVEARFLYTLPRDELRSADRLFFQIEEAHWFYSDFLRKKYTYLPSFYLKGFAAEIFKHCALFQNCENDVDELFRHFVTYRSRIPVYGCVLLNPAMDKVALAQAWGGKSWGFAKGKLNEGEGEMACAVRETLEETGYDAEGHTNERDSISMVVQGKLVKLYYATDTPEDFPFEPQTRYEVQQVKFFPLDDLPKTFNVLPFLNGIRRWIAAQKKKAGRKGKRSVKTKANEKGTEGTVETIVDITSNRSQAAPAAAKEEKVAKKVTVALPEKSSPSLTLFRLDKKKIMLAFDRALRCVQ
jgi:mRNA-decapping enzyme subunit 2